MSKESEYHILKSGRVKAAGVAMDPIFDSAGQFLKNPGPDTVAEMMQAYQGLRKNPPLPIREAFFPRTRAEVKAITRHGPGLYRPILKTDQGPGQFAGFSVEREGLPFPFRINSVEGFAVVEHFLTSQLELVGKDGAVVQEEIQNARDCFRSGNYYDAYLALEQLEIACRQAGIAYRREADVGREGLFFIRPVRVNGGVKLSDEVAERVQAIINFQAEMFYQRALEARRRFVVENNLIARDGEFVSPVYFQADVLINPAGGLILDQIQLPDVGLFLTYLDAQGNQTLQEIQKLMFPLRTTVVDKLSEAIGRHFKKHGRRPIALITRTKVIEGLEDTLEIYELRVLGAELAAQGIATKIISCREAAGFGENELGLLFNVDPHSEEFKQLLVSHVLSTRPSRIIPDPFLKLAELEITGYQRKVLCGRELANFCSLVEEVEYQPERAYRQVLAVDAFLKSLGVEDLVLHFYLPNTPTPVAAFRFDIQSLHQVGKMVGEVNTVMEVRQVPISPERAVLFNKDGALYSVFRFMAVGGK